MPSVLEAAPPRVEEITSYAASFEEFMALPEGTLAQFIDDKVYLSPAPRPRHQDIVANLYAALRAYAADQGDTPGLRRSMCF